MFTIPILVTSPKASFCLQCYFYIKVQKIFTEKSYFNKLFSRFSCFAFIHCIMMLQSPQCWILRICQHSVTSAMIFAKTHKHMYQVSQKKNVLRSSGISRKSAALRDTARKRSEFLLFSIVLRTLQLLITLEPLDRFKWGFQQNVPLQMSTSIK